MSHPKATGLYQSEEPVRWTEALIRPAVEALQRQLSQHSGPAADGSQPEDESRRLAVVEALVRLGTQPEILDALCQRLDPEEAIHDLATRYAFAALMVEGRPFHELDPMSQTLVQHTLTLIYERAAQVARRTGEDPLDEDPGLLLSICRCLSRYVPRRPIGAHISWKLRHYEGSVSRAMRQIENLVKRPEVSGPFAEYVLTTDLPDAFKAQLLQLARGGGRGGINYEAVIRFFAQPATVAFVKRFADTVQTARTLYDEQEYYEIPWRGQRRLPAKRRQGYLDAALASLEQQHEVSLDADDLDVHDLLHPTGSTAWLGGIFSGAGYRLPARTPVSHTG
jgi:uncharacterized protein YerC